MRAIINGDELKLGVCYYPEHWDKSNWESDLERMKEAGIKVVRVAEFAWNTVEPEEGVFTFEFWDEFLDLAESKGMGVIFGTPTATPPAWLTEKYPEVLNCDIYGNRINHGARRHYNYNSPIYQKLSHRIVKKEAKHFGQHPAIIGWQLDNEFNCENNEFYSESDTLAFREFLKEKYNSIDKLNESWGTVFWNQTYNSFEQIYVPRHTNGDTQNPHLLLDYKRFISDSVFKFAAMQAKIIRKYCKEEDFITTNGIFANIDYQRLVREGVLDFMTYDSYPNFAFCLDSYREKDKLKDRRWSRNLSEVRAMSSNFGIMEQQGGANGWYNRMEAPTPRPGQLRLWTMQSIAHGADFVSFFRWRTCTFGTEMYWHGILDYSGRDNRRLAEVKKIYSDTAKLNALAGTKYEAKVGIIKDYDNEWDADIDHWHGRIKWDSESALFEELTLSHTPFDYVYMEAEDRLSNYDVLFYPTAEILTEDKMDRLKAFVEGGGKLVFSCRTGQKDEFGRCVQTYLPGLAGELTGADVCEYSMIAPDEGKVSFNWNGEEIESSIFYELVNAKEDAKLLATYSNGAYVGEGALIKKQLGNGCVYYLGCGLSRSAVKAFLKDTGAYSPYEGYISLPEECEVAVRGNDSERYLFVLNYSSKEAEVNHIKPAFDMLSGEMKTGQNTLPAYGVGIYRL